MEKRLGETPDVLVGVVQRSDQVVVGTQVSVISPFEMTGEQINRIAPASCVSSPVVDGLLRPRIRQLSCTPPKSHFSSLNRSRPMRKHRVCGYDGAFE